MIREVLEYPNPSLRAIAKPIETVDVAIQQLADDMLDTMYAAPGIGLAATQIGVSQQLLVVDISKDQTEPLVFINPQVLQQDDIAEMEEGCLSFPGVYAKVKRAQKITVSALNRDGEPFEMSAEGLLAVCIQHEIDHLRGIVFVDHLSSLKRQRLLKKLEKQRKISG